MANTDDALGTFRVDAGASPVVILQSVRDDCEQGARRGHEEERGRIAQRNTSAPVLPNFGFLCADDPHQSPPGCGGEQAMSQVYNLEPPTEGKAVLVIQNYGEVSAVEHATCPHHHDHYDHHRPPSSGAR